VSFPPQLLDELARVYAHAAVDALLAVPSGEDLKVSRGENSDSPTGKSSSQVAQDATASVALEGNSLACALQELGAP
jgi:hypothetical protein